MALSGPVQDVAHQAARVDAVVLLGVTAFILYEAYRRFVEPTEILGWPMMLVALVGLGVNLASMKLLAGGSSESLNVKGAYFEVFSDMLGSLGVIVAAAIAFGLIPVVSTDFWHAFPAWFVVIFHSGISAYPPRSRMATETSESGSLTSPNRRARRCANPAGAGSATTRSTC